MFEKRNILKGVAVSYIDPLDTQAAQNLLDLALLGDQLTRHPNAAVRILNRRADHLNTDAPGKWLDERLDDTAGNINLIPFRFMLCQAGNYIFAAFLP